MPLSHSLSSHLWTSLSRSLTLTLSTSVSHSYLSLSHSGLSHHSTPVSSLPTSHPKPPISLRPTSPFANPPVSSCHPPFAISLKLTHQPYLTGKPMELADPPLLPTQLADVVLVCDWWFFILFVIGDFVWFGLRKKIGDLGWFFFFSYCGWWWLWVWLWLWLMVEVVVVGAWCCGCFLGSGIYDFIVVVILTP